MGLAFTMYGRLEEADPLVASLCQDKDPILRRPGMYTIAMAYCGTGNNQAIRRERENAALQAAGRAAAEEVR